ncbi:Por secretion system C-terminal sorting domain-containing protein [Chryseobacterium ureilyticum]|uniref:Por secretion system C-terminal sorting domain-containing protein n=1 Tax=Chryseobacterium ureilyticum TaxID=373668 RepID=A0A1N7L1E0_9FLAO|nr:T9SS type A sorting domain-containing protein [Chryseobacterium ureilyticum]SIS67669.1 Por secretion system C-terminal sorting domain-containing protein [Chryseobacterium ureilyticum]
MKKFYTIAFSVLATLFFAQQTASFEDNEGFIEGNIHGQGDWISTPTGGIPENITNQIICVDHASDGERSLKIVKEPVFGTQTEPIIGAFYLPPTPIAYNNFSVSFDINMSQLNGSVFGFQGVDSIAEQFIVRLDFDKTGAIKILRSVSGVPQLVSTGGIWLPNTWYKVKLIGTATEIKYYLNDNLIYTSSVVNLLNMDQLRFVHDNTLGVAYIDNVKINNEIVLSVKDSTVKDDKITLYPNPVEDYLYIKSESRVNNVEIFNLDGQKIDVICTDNKVNVKKLQPNTYFMKAIIDGRINYQKFIKK